MELPIDVIPGTSPPQFKWQHSVDCPDGVKLLDQFGCLPPGADVAVSKMIDSFKKVVGENAKLRGKLAEQSEMLHKIDKPVASTIISKKGK